MGPYFLLSLNPAQVDLRCTSQSSVPGKAVLHCYLSGSPLNGVVMLQLATFSWYQHMVLTHQKTRLKTFSFLGCIMCWGEVLLCWSCFAIMREVSQCGDKDRAGRIIEEQGQDLWVQAALSVPCLESQLCEPIILSLFETTFWCAPQDH